MKLFKRFRKYLRRGFFIASAILVSSYMYNSLSLSNEARVSLIQEVQAVEQPPKNFIEIVVEQLEKNRESAARNEKNRLEAIEHRAFKIELKRQEIQQMEEEGYVLTGNFIDDTITRTRYKTRQACLKNDWALGDLTTEREMEKIVEINNKIAEGTALTDEEKTFYATMSGTREAYETAKRMTDSAYINKGSSDVIQVSNFSTVAPELAIKGNRTVYIYKNQIDVINSINNYMGNIQKEPGRFIVRIKNHRTSLIHMDALEEPLIELFNKRGIAVMAKPSNFYDVELYFSHGGVLDNRINPTLSPYEERSVLDYIVPEKRDEHEIDMMEKMKAQQQSEELLAIIKKESLFDKIRNKFTKSE